MEDRYFQHFYGGSWGGMIWSREDATWTAEDELAHRRLCVDVAHSVARGDAPDPARVAHLKALVTKLDMIYHGA